MDYTDSMKIPRTAYLVATIALLGVLLRFLFSLRLPEFNDESFLLRWALDFWDGHYWQSIVEHNKKPGHIWLLAFFVRALPEPLLAGRLLSNLVGGVDIFLAYLVGRRLFDQRTGVAAALLTALCPYLVIFDGIIGQEPLVGMAGLVMLLLIHRLLKEDRNSYAMGAGLVLGAALIVKEMAALYGLLAVALFFRSSALSTRRAISLSLLMAFGAAACFFAVMTYPLALGKGLFIGREFISASPLNERLGDNLVVLLSATGWYLGPLYLLPLLYFTWRASREKTASYRLGLLSVALFILGMLIFAVTGKKLFPRYLLAFVPMLMPFAAAGVVNIARSKWRRPALIVLAVCVLPTFYLLLGLISSPVDAAFVEVDRRQFITGWPAGTRLDDVCALIDEQATVSHVYVLAPPLDGMPKDALLVRYRGAVNVTVIPDAHLAVRPASENEIVQKDHARSGARLLIVVNSPVVRLEPIVKQNPDARLLGSFDRPGGVSRLIVLDVSP